MNGEFIHTNRWAVPLLPWSCDKCDVHGELEIPAGTDVRHIPEKVFDAHRTQSNACHAKWGGRFVRVRQVAPLPE